MQDHDSASDSGQYSEGEWEQLGGGASSSSRNGGAHHGDNHDDGTASSKKGGKKDLSHVACRFFRVGACTAGSSCPFSHSAREPGQGKPVCKWFQKGSCKFGHKCANAHVMPGDPPSMDWKNKKAAKVTAQSEAATSTNGQMPPSPSSAAAVLPASPPGRASLNQHLQHQQQSPPQHQQSAATLSSGLSTMFGRTGPGTGNASASASASGQQGTGSHGLSPPTAAQQNGFLSAVSADQGAAIGMSPVGLPLPADLPLPPGASQSMSNRLPGNEPAPGQSANKPKPFSYASAVAAANAAAAAANAPVTPHAAAASAASPKSATAPPSSSPVAARLVSPPVSAAGLPALGRSPAAAAQASPVATYASKTVNAASPSFTPRVPLNATQQAAAQASSASRLSSSVPSTFNMDRLERNLPNTIQPDLPHGHLPHVNQQQGGTQPTSPYQRQPHHPSPLAPPPMQHSLSHSNTIPTRASLLHSAAGGGGPLSPAAMPHHGHSIPHHPRASGSTGNIFGTSPFGANAIFLSSSHEEEAGSYMSRGADRAPGARRHMSPARPGFEPSSASARGSLDSRVFMRNKHGSSALADDYEDGNEDDKVLEEELVPSSLKHLLTPDEKARRQSRSGAAAQSGFFNPFDDDNDNDEEDFDRHLEAELRQRYSQSVPAAVSGYFNKAPGSPPTFTGNAGYLSNLGRPPALSPGYDAFGSNANGNLARQMLVGGGGAGASASTGQHTHKIERGFRTADSNMGSHAGNDHPHNGPGYLSTLGSSLPQGMAVGLSRLHMIPAGSEHTGYTPPNSFVQSPSQSAHFTTGTSASQAGAAPGLQALNAAGGTSGSSLLAPGGPGPRNGPVLGTSYGIKLPSLLGQQHPGAGPRKPSGNYYEANQVHVGSPLARHEIHGHIGSGREASGAAGTPGRPHDPQGQAHDPDEDDLVFDMDV